ncbi:recombinase family protein [Micromonospora globbae]|uniref:recombinase family protein n=1 Tax=Micromonospora globbae TaxID=1894969 RepID=UPI00386CDCA5|nr:recombinase family protein [Micromonospora globbae]
MRVLAARRLSRERDESTSFERQAQDIERVAVQELGGTVVDTADDMDVSAGTVGPFDRAGLGPYLKDPEKIAEYDAIAWSKLDRAIRNMMDLNGLALFAVEHKKMLIFCTGPGGSLVFDFRKRDPITNLLLQFLAFAAELEWLAISQRNKESSDYLRRVGRYKGGPIPAGYMKAKNPNGNGYVLVHDPVMAPVVQEAVSRVIDGETPEAICRDFTAREILTPREHSARRAGKPYQLKPWGPSALTNDILRSRNLLGETEYFAKDEDGKPIKDENGKRIRRVVRDDKGMPVLRGEPLISYEDWERLQAALDKRGVASAPRRHDANPLLGVAKCIKCSANLYRRDWKDGKGKVFSWYYCKNKCTPGINAELLESRILHGIVSTFGHLEVLEKRYVPGEDSTEELAKVRTAIESLRQDREAGLYDMDREDDRKSFQDSMRRLMERRSVLEAKPSRPARWEHVPTGKTYREVFTNSSLQERRRILLKAEVIAYAGKPKDDAERFALLGELLNRGLVKPASRGISDLAGPLALHMFFDEEIERRLQQQ